MLIKFIALITVVSSTALGCYINTNTLSRKSVQSDISRNEKYPVFDLSNIMKLPSNMFSHIVRVSYNMEMNSNKSVKVENQNTTNRFDETLQAIEPELDIINRNVDDDISDAQPPQPIDKHALDEAIATIFKTDVEFGPNDNNTSVV